MTEQTLPGFEPSAADLTREAMARPLAEKIETAIATLRLWEEAALARDERGYWLAYSGGKDSDAILELARMAGVAYSPAYSVTTIDPPELVRYIRREHALVEFVRPRKALLVRLAEDGRGPPTRLQRWCCDEYKEHGGAGMVKLVGVRAAESARRAKTWKTVVPNRRSGAIVCPILYWTDADVWAFHALRGIPHCELYDEGFRRIGCIGCPLAGPAMQRREFDRWPRYEQAWRRAFERYWARWHGVPTIKGKQRWFEEFGSWEALWDWWVSGVAKQDGDDGGCQMELLFT